MTAPPLRPFDLLRSLREHDVEFVVIGGFSLAAHGYVRATKDLDIVPAPGRANLARLLAALAALDAEPVEVGEFAPTELPVALDLEGLAAGGNWALRTRYGRLDVMQFVAGIQGYDRLRRNAAEIDLADAGGSVLFAGRDDLVAMKSAAGRAQDLVDLEELARTASGS
jgi:hypothetical protein